MCIRRERISRSEQKHDEEVGEKQSRLKEKEGSKNQTETFCCAYIKACCTAGAGTRGKEEEER